MNPSRNSISLRLEQYMALVEIFRELVSNLDLHSLLAQIAEKARDLIGAEAASILLYNDSTRELFFESATGIDEPVMRGLSVPMDSIAGWIVQHNQAVILTDVRDDPRFYPAIEKTTHISTRSLLGIPLVVQERVIGALEVINKQNGHFDDSDQEILSILSSQAALAIENTRLFHQSDQIAELVHELRTPLSSISTAAYILQQPGLQDSQRISIAATIHQETSRLSDMATTFLDLSRLESGRVRFNPVEFEISGLIKETIKIMQAKAQEAKVTLSADLQENLPLLRADRDKLKQVLINLISNAIKFNHPGGNIGVICEHEEKRFRLVVRDDGIGMSPEAISHLFERYYRARGSDEITLGTGLGLSICKKIIESHSGRILVESRQGEGTTFTIQLPG